MKAARFHGRHDVRIESVAEPRPSHHDVVLEVTAASICGSDAAEWAHGPLVIPLHKQHPGNGHLGPVTLGHEFVGRVIEVGTGVDGIVVGDRLVSGAGISCGTCGWCIRGRTNLCATYYTLGFHADGGLAAQVRTPAYICRKVPDAISDHAATLTQPLSIALHAVHRGASEAGADVAVIGAGGIGAFVIAALAPLGLGKLIAVDISDVRLATAGRLGATHSVDARKGDPISTVRDLTGIGAQVVIECSGVHGMPGSAIRMAARGGRVVMVGLQDRPAELDLLDCTLREVDLVTSFAHVCSHDLPRALELLASPHLAGAVIEQVIPLEELVDHALRPLAEHRAGGKIVIDPRLGG